MRKTALYFFVANIILGGTALAADPMPGYDTVPDVEQASGPGVTLGSTPYPPLYLPGGAINLDDVWTQNGGARMYWNSTRYPIQLNMAGQTWVDPALVPELFPQKVAPAPKKRYRPRRVKARPKPKLICFPADQVPEALRPKNNAIPVPVTPVKPKAEKAKKAPVAQAPSPPQAQPAHRPAVVQTPSPLEPPPDEDTSVPAPRLQ